MGLGVFCHADAIVGLSLLTGVFGNDSLSEKLIDVNSMVMVFYTQSFILLLELHLCSSELVLFFQNLFLKGNNCLF